MFLWSIRSVTDGLWQLSTWLRVLHELTRCFIFLILQCCWNRSFTDPSKCVIKTRVLFFKMLHPVCCCATTLSHCLLINILSLILVCLVCKILQVSFMLATQSPCFEYQTSFHMFSWGEGLWACRSVWRQLEEAKSSLLQMSNQSDTDF